MAWWQHEGRVYWKRTVGIAACLLAMHFVPNLARAADEQPFHIQAHRGAGITRPENTLEAFEQSWRLGVMPEADLRTTKNGVIVCFHDANLARVVSNPPENAAEVGVEDLTLREVQALEVGSFRGDEFSGQRIPTLESVFSAMRGRPERLLYLDIKAADLELLVTLIRDYDLESQVIFTTTHHRLIRDWKKRLPQSLTLLWNGGSEAELTKKLAAVRDADFEGITHLQIHVRVGELASDEPFMPSTEFLRKTGEKLKERGIVFQTLPWECSDRRAYVKLLELGAESFATDYPEVTLDAVAEFRARATK
jgi:glycerophosphoryl diester phosphodiesterase